MRNLLLLFLFSISLCAFGADDVSYDWVIEQYKNGETISDAEGRIDGDEYVVIIECIPPPSYASPFLLVLRKTVDQFDVIAKIDLGGCATSGVSVAIKNNSLFLEHWVGHHGMHGARYQFKQVNRKFRLIGEEYRSEYFDNDEQSTCMECSVFVGTSYNFRTSSALSWEEKVHLKNEKRWKEEIDRLYKWLQPKGGSKRQMKCHPIDLPLLDGFDIYSFSAPKCH
jgi:hypothetical protein